MDRSWYLRLLLVLGTLGLSLYFLYPSYFYYAKATPEQRESNEAFCKALPRGLPCVKFNLGLDLQGGVNLVMGVRVDKAIEQRADRLADGLRDTLTEENLSFVRLDRPRDTSEIVLEVANVDDVDAVEKVVRRDYKVLEVVRRKGAVLTFDLASDERAYIRDTTVEQAIKTIRNRADKFGVTEPTIARRGEDNILIQLPGVKDPERAIKNIGRMAQLEFKMVDEPGTAIFDEIPASELPEGVTQQDYSFEGPGGQSMREVYFELPESQQDAVRTLLEPKIPQERVLAFGPVGGSDSSAGGHSMVRTYLLMRRAGITGDYLTDANVQQNQDLATDYYVIMTFDANGAKVFERLTEEYTRRHMAIVLDEKVTSAPIIEEKIAGGTARIMLGRGGDSQAKFQEAKDLSLVLKAGALPAPIEMREKREVGKTLGQDSVSRASAALAVGALLVVLFMVLYYRASGFIADLALVLNVLLILGVLAMFEATLTVPGMAGILLTIGMAVDANVIINERIREELRVGKTPRAAIAAGYDKAFSAIFDSNVTTIIAGVVLFQYGSGPVRGFAVTLIIGILASMFTAIVVTRLIFDFFSSRRRLQTLSI
ncbi:MAG: protein translocase subunit SecD [Myxococcota bacterium]